MISEGRRGGRREGEVKDPGGVESSRCRRPRVGVEACDGNDTRYDGPRVRWRAIVGCRFRVDP